MRTFSCTFRPGITATVHVSDSPPEKGKSHVQNIAWSDEPRGKWIIEPYIKWMNSVQQQLANEWGIKLMYVYQTGPKWSQCQVWIFEPGKPPFRDLTTPKR